MKKSSSDGNRYFVLFDDGDTGYYDGNDLKFVSRSNPTVRTDDPCMETSLLVRKQPRNIEEEVLDSNNNKRRKAIISILCGVKLNVKPDSITYNEIIQPFKVEFPWLTTNILRKHVSNANSKLFEVKEENLHLEKQGTTGNNDYNTNNTVKESSFCKDADDESEVYSEEELTHEMWDDWTKGFRQRSLEDSCSSVDELDDDGMCCFVYCKCLFLKKFEISFNICNH